MKIIIFAGPNGAGKTTFASEFLPKEAGCAEFINADLIAAGIAPFKPDSAAIIAGRLMLKLMKEHIERRQSFAFETTLAGIGYAQEIPRWQKLGYSVELLFLALPSAEIAMERVNIRVQQGGHSIPRDVIRRRFDSGVKNLRNVYCNLVNSWAIYDNSGNEPVLMEWGTNECL